jgi:fructosamine-3-kinase
MRFLEDALARSLGRACVRVEQASPVSGGCIHQARRVRTSEGEFFVKWSAHGPTDIFVREAEGLEALRSAGDEIVIPRVIAAAEPSAGSPAFLVLEYLEPGGRHHLQDAARLGRGLAAIHRRRGDRFGFAAANYCGLTRQDNRWCDEWPSFYRDRRIKPLVDTLDRRGLLSVAERESYERLMSRLSDLLPGDTTPSLIHGDLWSGNVLEAADGPALVDPACAFADREMEFGITTLFGGLSARALSAYEETWPLPASWRERNPLYQLYHLLNHAVLFGGHYIAEARRTAGRYVG